MNSTTKQLDKMLTNAINLVKSGSFTDQQVMEIYSEQDGHSCEITRNQDGTFNVEVSIRKGDGSGKELMMERNVA